MKIESGRVLDRLPAEERCLGAVFASYSFDPAFFEENVLRAVLRLTSDPLEQAERYHNEARRALQETPVAVIVDAGERRAGRRLPYDLLEVSEVVFHPKSVLLIYRDFARLLVGSGNLTRQGFGENTELFVSADLSYDNGADTVLLDAFDQHLDRVRSLVRRTGSQLDNAREELRRRLHPVKPARSAAGLAFLDSTTGPIMNQFAALLPMDAIITSVGMLAPFYEKDDADTDGSETPDETSVFGAFAGRIADDATLDVGLRWENPQIQPTPLVQLGTELGRIWTFAGAENGPVLKHRIPIELTRSTVIYLDEVGQRRRLPLAEVLSSVADRSFWMQPAPVAFAPLETIARAGRLFSRVRYWLHPTSRLVDGRPTHRPLHAKMLAVGYRSGLTEATLVLMGSPNMSRRALLMQAGHGNVEVGLAFSIEGRYELHDFVPDLVHAPLSACIPKERKFPETDHNYALAIDEVSHDPRARSLHITWAPSAAELTSWRLSYDGSEIGASVIPPSESVHINDFILSPSTAEIVLHVKGKDFPVPILVTDLVELPVTSSGAGVGLEELLMLLSRRIGTERTLLIANRRTGKGGDDLALHFGEGFAPTDVFKAWWCAAEDLADPELSFLAFRLRLEGALGIGAAWSCMLDAVAQGSLSREEAWFYGAELLRSFSDFVLPTSPDHEAKLRTMSAFRLRVRSDMKAIRLAAGSRSWNDLVLRFYEEATT